MATKQELEREYEALNTMRLASDDALRSAERTVSILKAQLMYAETRMGMLVEELTLMDIES